MNIFINYADNGFYDSQKFGCESALLHGFDEAIDYRKKDIDEKFYREYSHILTLPRGSGYWLWKPYFILKTLEKINYGDYLCYADSGTNFIDNVYHLINTLNDNNQDIIPFDLQQQTEKKWTKRDVFIYNNCDIDEIINSNICDAAVQFFKKTEYTINFYKEYLEQSCIENLITDSPNLYGKINYPEFTDHRHDQSIYSVNIKKRKLKTFRSPAQWGIGFENLYKNSNYPQLINHHRKK